MERRSVPCSPGDLRYNMETWIIFLPMYLRLSAGEETTWNCHCEQAKKPRGKLPVSNQRTRKGASYWDRKLFRQRPLYFTKSPWENCNPIIIPLPLLPAKAQQRLSGEPRSPTSSAIMRFLSSLHPWKTN